MGGEAAHKPLSHYRPDIDGLRAVAVLAVVWFHSGLPGLPGGFVGVDVFFVISGFLITSIIRREAEQGRFSFAHFYERRFRRIAPALVTVIAATTVTAFVLLLPYELEEYAASAVAALDMSSNLLFWRTTNYFATTHAIVPLLHTWSLGVEEQFYLFFPAAFVLAERERRPAFLILIAGALSFALCAGLTEKTPAAPFYLLPTRGWELMVGAALAQGSVTLRPRIGRYAGIVGGITLVDVSEGFCRSPSFELYSDNSHPSRYAGLAIIAPAIRAALQTGR